MKKIKLARILVKAVCSLVLLVAIFCIFILSSCKKDNVTPLPYAPVYFTININNPQYNALQNVGGWVYVPGGAEGIILFRANTTAINAFDRLSTYDPDRGCQMYVDSSNVFAVDSCSHSTFSLFDGSPASGPATVPMMQYESLFDGTILTVQN